MCNEDISTIFLTLCGSMTYFIGYKMLSILLMILMLSSLQLNYVIGNSKIFWIFLDHGRKVTSSLGIFCYPNEQELLTQLKSTDVNVSLLSRADPRERHAGLTLL